MDMKNETFKQIINNQMLTEEESFFSDIEFDKNLTWKKIEKSVGKKNNYKTVIYSLAAVIILLLGISGLLFVNIQNQNLPTKQVSQNVIFLKKKSGIHSNFILKTIDTVEIIKIKNVYIENIFRDTINNYITISDTVFVKEFNDEIIAENDSKNTVNENYTLHISNEIPEKKKFKIKFRFGNNFESPIENQQSFVSLRTNL